MPTDDYASDTDSLVLSSSACTNDQGLLWPTDDVPLLQARGQALCPPSKPNENAAPTFNLLQDPEGSLRQLVPPTGHLNPSGPDEKTFDFDSFLNSRPILFNFEEDGKTCDAAQFGLSITPVCLDHLKGSAIPDSGHWFTLYDVEPRRS